MPWTLFDTALGTCGLAWSDAGVCSLQLPEETAAATEARLRAKAGRLTPADKASPRSAPAWVRRAIALAKAHLEGEPQDFSGIPLDFAGIAPFHADVYRALRTVPPGTTVTYGDLARLAGSPSASRAVGRAMATNPVPLLVACHRVVAAGKASGTVPTGGFSAYGGLLTKERILRLEGWPPPATEAVAPLLARAPRAPRLPYDPAAARAHLTEADARLGAHVAKVGDFTLELKDTEGVFGALAEAIVYQQLSGKAAATIFGRVRALFPGGKLAPEALLRLDEDLLRRAGLSRAKLAGLTDLARRTAAGELPTLAQLRRMDDDAIVESLTRVRGIGRWTVEMLLIFRLGRPDVLPVGDYGVRKGYALVFGKRRRERNDGKEGKDELPTEAALRTHGERWRPFRSVATWYLWRAIDIVQPGAS